MSRVVEYMPNSNDNVDLHGAVARVEAKVDSQQEILCGQREEMGKISDAIVTLARLDEHLLRFREEDRTDKKRIWESLEGQSTRLRGVEENVATIKDVRGIFIALLLTVAGGGFAILTTVLEFK